MGRYGSGFLPGEPTQWNGDFTEPFPPEPEEDDEPEVYQCDCCGRMVPVDELTHIRHDAPGNSAGCDTSACEQCCSGLPPDQEK